MTTAHKCPECGAILPAGSTVGFCPGCSFLGAISIGEEPQVGNDTEPVRLSSGAEFGNYELLEEIGRGGMGVVFKARQASLNRFVAVKMLLHGRFANRAFRRRFRLEAEAAALLEHPNIVSIHEIGEHAGQPFFSMRWVEGHSLDRRLIDGPLPVEQSVHFIATLAHAVHHAHQHGVLHRDLKPHNVIIDGKGEPHLTDFGLAKLLESETGLTISETVLGSPGFIAPEQAEGPKAAVTTAADTFSLGAMFYMMLTGKPPFSAETPVATLRQVIECDPPRPLTLAPTLPRDLETICLKCLQKEPSRRYGSAEALAHDLERWKSNEPILARPVSDLERIWLWCRRQPLRAGLIAALALSILAGAVGIGSQWLRAETQARRAEEEALTASRHAYASQISLVQTHLEHRQSDQAQMALSNAGPESLRGWEWGWLQRRCNQDLMTLPADGTKHMDCEFSPDGRFLVTGSADGIVRIWDLQSDSPPQRIQGGDDFGVHLLILSPDGHTAVTTHWDQRMKVWDLDRKVLAYQFGDPENFPTCAAFSPDGTLFATGRKDGRIQLRDQDTGTVLRDLAHFEDGFLMELTFSPDGTQLAFIGGGSGSDRYDELPVDLRILDLATETERRFPGHTAAISGVAFSPDGEWIATAGYDGTVRITPARGDEPLRIIDNVGPGRIFYIVAFSPDSRQLAAVGADTRTVRRPLLHTIDIESEKVTEIETDYTEMIWEMAYSSDGQTIAATSGGTLKLWPAHPRPAFLSLEGHDHDVWAVAVSPDGQYAATGSLDTTAKVWEMQTGQLVRTIQGHYPVLSLAFTPDSKHLVANSSGRTARVWPIRGTEAALELAGHEDVVFAVATDPKGRWIATGSRDKTVRLWDASTGELLLILAGHKKEVTCVTFSPDGNRLATGSGELAVWEVPTGRRLFEIRGHDQVVTSVLFSPDGQTIATASLEGTARIWNADTSQAVGRRMVNRQGGIKCIAFSPDGSRLLTTGAKADVEPRDDANKTVTFWDVATGERLWEFTPHNALTFAMAFSPGGTRLITGGGDNTARIWSVFPWRTADYPGTDQMTPETRLKLLKRKYWSQTTASMRSPDRQMEARPWGEENVPKSIQIRTRPRLPIPPRSGDAMHRQINLSDTYNAALNEAWQPVFNYWRHGGDLAALQSGNHVFHDIPFDLRGVIQLGINLDNWIVFPQSVEISIDQKIRRFHVAHSAAFGLPAVSDGTVIGFYRMRFENGDAVRHEIIYGTHLRTFWEGDEWNAECKSAELIWKSKRTAGPGGQKHRRLFMTTYENPRPESEVTHIEFISGSTNAAPFLVGMTVE